MDMLDFPKNPKQEKAASEASDQNKDRKSLFERLLDRLPPMPGWSTTIFWVVVVVEAILAYTSYLTTKDGFIRATGDVRLATLVAFSMNGGLFIISVIITRHFARVDPKGRLKFLGLVVLATAIMLFGSTIFSAIYFGGRDAKGAHMGRQIQNLEELRTEIVGRLAEEANHQIEFDMFVSNFEDRAKDERMSVYSGLAGEGFAFRNFKSVATTFRSLSAAVAKAETRAKELDADLVVALGEARATIMALYQETNWTELQRLDGEYTLAMSKAVAKLVEMNELNSSKFIQSANNNLTSITTVIGSAPTTGQNQAVQDLMSIVKGAQQTVSELIQSSQKRDRVRIPTSVNMSELKAIFIYWRETPYAIPAALALDLLWVVFMYIFYVIRTHDPEEAAKAEGELARIRMKTVRMQEELEEERKQLEAQVVERRKHEEAEAVARRAREEAEAVARRAAAARAEVEEYNSRWQRGEVP